MKSYVPFSNRCFYLSKKVSQYADQNPETREECEEIAQDFRKLSVQILDHCKTTAEAQTILDDKTGSSKYFRRSLNMMLPRLHLAIEHNHKEFVGHPLCQQVFMQFYRQGVPFHGHSLIFQILHLILQIILAPILVGMTLFIWVGKNVSLRFGIDKDIPALFGYKKWHVDNISWTRKSINLIIDFAFYTRLSLEVPLNRFIIDTGYYIIFVILLGWTVLNKSFGYNIHDFSMHHVWLTVYALSMLWQDLSSLRNVRSFRIYAKYWRMYDLIMHVTLAFALIFRSARVLSIDPLVPSMNETAPSASSTQSPDIASTSVFNDFEDVCFSLVSIMAIVR